MQENTSNRTRKEKIAAVLVVVALFIGFAALLYTSICSTRYGNWRGPFMRQQAAEMFGSYVLTGAIDGSRSCFTEQNGSFLIAVNQRDSDNTVLVDYRTNHVTENHCENGRRVRMSLRAWNEVVIDSQRDRAAHDERARDERRVEETARRLTQQGD